MKRINGLNRDVNPMDQPAGSYRYAKNIVVDVSKTAIVSEPGDGKDLMMEIGHFFVGQVVLDNGDIVIFSRNGGAQSEIGVLKPNAGTYTVIFNDGVCIEKLDFNPSFPIEAEYKINATDNVTVYWTDDNNPPRFINLVTPPIAVANLQIDVAFDIFPKISKYPKVLLNQVTNGGTLNVGAYFMTLQFVTEDGATTNYLDISNPVYINEENEATANSPFGWGENYNVNGYDGADAGTSSGKKIVMEVNNIDTSYTYVRPIFIHQEAGVRTAVALPDKPINNTSTMIIQYTGFEPTETVTLADIQIPRANYDKAKTVAQVDDVLYFGNLVRSKIDLGYQKYANNIKIKSEQLDANAGANDSASNQHINQFSGVSIDGVNYTTNNNHGFGRSAHDNYYFKGYDRDEVYAFYITWILKDGSETVAYHIPGRPPVDALYLNGAAENAAYDSVANVADRLYLRDNADYAGGAVTTKMFHTSTEGAKYVGGRDMGFWENQNETYPTIAQDTNGDFFTLTVDAAGNSVPVPGGSLHGQKVRHHHFPAESTVQNAVGDDGVDVRSKRPDQGGGFIWDGGYAGNQTSVKFNPLGFKAYDIPFPAEIVDKVLGYKIYYSNRTSTDATVIDQGMVSNLGKNNTENNTYYTNPLSIAQTLEESGHIFSFDGYHSLTTQDSIEAANVFKGVRYHQIGNFYGNGQYFAMGVSHFTIQSDGVSCTSIRATRFFIDWARQRPVEFLAENDWKGFKPNTHLNSLGVTEGSHLSFLKNKTYLNAGSVSNTLVPGTTIDNIDGTQSIICESNLEYKVQSWSGRQYAGTDPLAAFNIYDSTGPKDGPEYTIDNAVIIENDELKKEVGKRACIFGNLYAIKDDVYLDFQNRFDLVYTGHLYKTDALNAPQIINPNPATAEIVMGGDTFLAMVGITKMNTYTGINPEQVNIADGTFEVVTHPAGLGNLYTPVDSNNNIYDHCTHLFPSTSRSHLAMRQRQVDNVKSYFMPSVPPNHKHLINSASNYARDYDFNDDYNAECTVKLLNTYDYANPITTLEDFPTRIIRSIKYNQSGLTDNFRVFLAGQYRDLPRHRGELWRLEAMKSILIPHMERSLMVTRGKEELAVGAVSAALGSGDLFERDPVEVITTERGEGGTRSQFAGVVTKNGYFYVDVEATKVYMFTDSIEEISAYGMSDWFRNNFYQPLTAYGMPEKIDIPTVKIGAVAGYDPEFDRCMLTYHWLEPTDYFKQFYATGQVQWYDDIRSFAWLDNSGGANNKNGGGAGELVLLDWKDYEHWFTPKYWTISYYPALKGWGSFHDYDPVSYAYSVKDMYKFSIHNLAVYRHNSGNVPGLYFDGHPSDIEFEFIDNTNPADDKLFSSVEWTLDVQTASSELNGAGKIHSPGFTNIYVYNTHQMSREETLVPMAGVYNTNINTRRTERGWHFNKFRDDAALAGTPFVASSAPMFIEDGMNITQDVTYLNLAKPFQQRKKFIDKYLGVRLLDKSSQTDRKVISLYLADTSKRKVYR